ncbi:hypothetical protein [Streptomyces sp. NPDC046631]|uniref:hypothetical protein n=1 Tax=unclassified Streptomyces TaxID=2593676 RepID=UPI0033E72DB4
MAHDLGVLVEILTNGSRLAAPKHLAPLTRRRPNRITLSLYGATAKSYDGPTRRKGAYRMFLQGLTAAHEADLPLGLALIITRHNAHEADQMRASADRYGLPSREYTHMSPTIYGGAAPSSPRHPTISPTASRCGAATPATRSSMSIRGGMAPICKVGRDKAIPLITEGVEGDLPDFLWVLADGFGPMKAALDEEREARHDAALADLAERTQPPRAGPLGRSSPRRMSSGSSRLSRPQQLRVEASEHFKVSGGQRSPAQARTPQVGSAMNGRMESARHCLPTFKSGLMRRS